MSKKISFLIVTLNCEKYINDCLEGLVRQGVCSSQIEVLIIDGKSSDKTVGLSKTFLEKSDLDYKIITNDARTLASGWNLGVKESIGEYIVRPDAHSVLEDNYALIGMSKLEKNPELAAVGGVLDTISKTFIGKLISLVLSNPIGVGPSLFRIGLSDDVETDTVVYGIYRRKVFETVGGFNESLSRNQDIEFHRRVKNENFKMITSPDLKAKYYSRGNVKSFLSQAYNNGFWVGKGYGHLRHHVPLLFVLTLMISVFLGVLYVSILLSAYLVTVLLSYLCFSKTFNIIKLFVLVILTFLLHVFYGLGTLIGKLR